MPTLLSFSGYRIYFWSNEGMPIEPIHVHVCNGIPQANATKIWLTSSGHVILSNNASQIPMKDLRAIMDIIEANHEYIEEAWTERFGDIHYFC